MATTTQKSVDSLIEEIERCRLLGIRYVLTHMGSHVGSGTEKGKARIIQALNRAIEHDGPVILLENGSGSGNHLGSHLEEISEILTSIESFRVGVCFDTCHAFGAGYDLRSPEGLENTMDRFDEILGLKSIRLVHLNDSKGDLGSGLDRHEHIGLGHIGQEGFLQILSHEIFKKIPLICETPVDARRDDEGNIRKVRELAV